MRCAKYPPFELKFAVLKLKSVYAVLWQSFRNAPFDIRGGGMELGSRQQQKKLSLLLRQFFFFLPPYIFITIFRGKSRWKCAAQKIRLLSLNLRFWSLNWFMLCEIEDKCTKRPQIGCFYRLALISPTGWGMTDFFFFQGWAMTNKQKSRVGHDKIILFTLVGAAKHLFSKKSLAPIAPLPPDIKWCVP